MPGWRLRAASTRTGRLREPAQRRAQQGLSRSCEVLGATSTRGPSPAGHSTRRPAAPRRAGPVTCTPRGHARGYSSWGKVADEAQLSLIPPYCRASCGRPTRRRVSLSSRRPRSTPLARSGARCAPPGGCGRARSRAASRRGRRAARRRRSADRSAARASRSGTLLELGRERGRQRQHVVHDHVGREARAISGAGLAAARPPPRRASAGARAWGRPGTRAPA